MVVKGAQAALLSVQLYRIVSYLGNRFLNNSFTPDRTKNRPDLILEHVGRAHYKCRRLLEPGEGSSTDPVGGPPLSPEVLGLASSEYTEDDAMLWKFLRDD